MTAIRKSMRILAVVLMPALFPVAVQAQNLRYSNHREVAIPDYALLRIGPFYSTLAFSQSAGWRYSRSRGTGTGYLDDNRFGAITADGTEYPLISILTMRNYLLLSRRTDVDLSVSASFAHYPRDTQKGGWQVFLPEEGISAGLSSEFMLTPYVRGTLYDNILYRTDFVDTRGLNDYYGGEEYRYFNNKAGINMDWLMAKNQNMALSFSREDMLPRDKSFEDQERTSYSEGAAYQYQLFSGLVLGAGADFVQHRYASTGRVDVSEQNYFVNIGFARDVAGQFRLTRATTGSLKVGYSRAAGASRSASTGETGFETASSGSAQSEAVSVDARLDTEVSKEITQSLTFRRGLRNGFDAPVEEYEQFGYRLSWRRETAGASVWSTVSTADPRGGLSGRYHDRSSGANMSFEIIRGVVFVASTTYSDRINSGNGDGTLSFESTADYATWTSTAGVRIPVTRSIGLGADYAHVERISGEPALAYTRDVAGATLTYSKQF